ncbi:MAG TPA: hypothetical protein VFX51_02750 [Solirubrobacteraceae bacterium]|nr:hypothetical protein [Solirubrobacteraceae bacterium]
MHLKQNRFLPILATAAAILAVGAAPAMAGEDDDGDDDEAPAQTAPAQVPSGVSGAPQGGVATGAGGTAAASGPDTVLLGLASGALVLMVTGGGMLRAASRPQA